MNKIYFILLLFIVGCSGNINSKNEYKFNVGSVKCSVVPYPISKQLSYGYDKGKKNITFIYDGNKMVIEGNDLFLNGFFYGELSEKSELNLFYNSVYIDGCRMIGRSKALNKSKIKSESKFLLSDVNFTVIPGASRIDISQDSNNYNSDVYTAIVGDYYIVLNEYELFINKKSYGFVSSKSSIKIENGNVFLNDMILEERKK